MKCLRSNKGVLCCVRCGLEVVNVFGVCLRCERGFGYHRQPVPVNISQNVNGGRFPFLKVPLGQNTCRVLSASLSTTMFLHHLLTLRFLVGWESQETRTTCWEGEGGSFSLPGTSSISPHCLGSSSGFPGGRLDDAVTSQVLTSTGAFEDPFPSYVSPSFAKRGLGRSQFHALGGPSCIRSVSTTDLCRSQSKYPQPAEPCWTLFGEFILKRTPTFWSETVASAHRCERRFV